LGQPPGGYLRGCRLRGAAVQLARQVRVGHRVAELHAAARGCERPPEVRPVAPHGADRGSVRPCRFAPGSRVRRRPGTDGPALLHQLGRAALHSGRAPRSGGLRALPTAVPDRAALNGTSHERDSETDTPIPCLASAAYKVGSTTNTD